MITTPLRYPGGKARAVKILVPLVPEFKEYREPFVGGGSVFIALIQRSPDKTYWINDLNSDLYHFWVELKEHSKQLFKGVQHIKDTEKSGRNLHTHLVTRTPKSSMQKAIRFFVLNRITFSGTIDSGGYSEGAFLGRFTQSAIERLKSVSPLLGRTKITNYDYEKVVTAKGKDVFLFLDPPYFSTTKSKLYGKKGDLHTTFDHARFARVMKKVTHKWLVTYDDCPEIRALFSFAYIKPFELQYGMNNYKKKTATKGKEIIITNYKL